MKYILLLLVHLPLLLATNDHLLWALDVAGFLSGTTEPRFSKNGDLKYIQDIYPPEVIAKFNQRTISGHVPVQPSRPAAPLRSPPSRPALEKKKKKKDLKFKDTKEVYYYPKENSGKETLDNVREKVIPVKAKVDLDKSKQSRHRSKIPQRSSILQSQYNDYLAAWTHFLNRHPDIVDEELPGIIGSVSKPFRSFMNDHPGAKKRIGQIDLLIELMNSSDVPSPEQFKECVSAILKNF